MGSVTLPRQLRLQPLVEQSRVGLAPTSARFYLAPKKRFFEALLDFVMVTPDLAAKNPDWRIWHPFNEPHVTAIPELRGGSLASCLSAPE